MKALQGPRTLLRRSLFSGKLFQQERSRNAANQFKNDPVSSVQERTLFEQIFLEIMKKDEKKNAQTGLGQSLPIKTLQRMDSAENLQIVFEKKKPSISDAKPAENGIDQKAVEEHQSPRLTKDDIRRYPVSLTSTYFAEQDVSKSALKGQNVSSPDLRLRSTVKAETVEKLETKEKLKAALQKALKPHLEFLSRKIHTDQDCLKQLKLYFDLYAKTANSTEKLNSETLKHVGEACRRSPSSLPQPYTMTLPYIVKHLLSDEEFSFPLDRRYTLITAVYTWCKRNSDLELYLIVCNVDFYNLLMKYSWENYQDIAQLRQLVTEMSVNGFLGDVDTIEILQDIVLEVNNSNIDNKTATDTYPVDALWCQEIVENLRYIERYLAKLKRSQL
ncbi:LAMI_0H19680g1_1 [Lachancea mirantina]|uniref:LAMI_0H19680g1_1 n=1 Tax=Lachancea mirantina TaxID=1230905 RepID=A0A1G4KK61_9SACH|nr:LAMI_0H19680g1_1 [Lachancea mirantina]